MLSVGLFITDLKNNTNSVECYQLFGYTLLSLRLEGEPGHGNLVLITLTAQVEFPKLNFNSDDIKN